MTEIVGFITIGTLLLIQIAAFAYGYGRISQKVDNLCQDVQENQEKITLLEKKIILSNRG